MKSIWFFLLWMMCGLAWAQTPQQFNFQGVARDGSGNPLSSQNIGVRITIRQGSATGPVQYQERHTTVTDAGGLFNLAVGSATGGNILFGVFSIINWSGGSLFLQVEIDPAGGTSYVNMGSSQMLSVPYSVLSKKTEQWPEFGNNMINNNSGKVGIGTLNPNAKLDVRSTESFTIIGGNTATNGTGVAGTGYIGVQGTSNANNGYGGFFNADQAGQVALYCSAPNFALLIAQGRVGVGTLTPLEKLEVDGAIKIGSTTEQTTPYDGTLRYLPGTGFQGRINNAWVTLGGGGGSQTLNFINPNLSISGGNSVNLSALNTDNQTLSLSGNSLSISGGNTITLPSGGGSSQWSNGSANAIYYSAGKVGIGTNAPLSTLDVSSTTSEAGYFYNDVNGFNAITSISRQGTGVWGESQASGSGVGIYGQSACSSCMGVYGFSINGTGGQFGSSNGAALITTSGKVGLGLNNPLEQLHVNGAIRMGNTSLNGLGTIRFNSTTGDFEGNVNGNAGGWKSLTADNQSLSLSGNTLSISNGNSVTLPSGGGAQTLSLSQISGSLAISGGNSVTLPFAYNGSEITTSTSFSNVGIGVLQPTAKLDVNGGIRIGNTTGVGTGTIRYNGSDIQANLSGNGSGWVSLTADSQQLSLNGNILTISRGNSVTLPSGGSSSWTTSGSDIYNSNAGKVLIGTTSGAAKFVVRDAPMFSNIAEIYADASGQYATALKVVHSAGGSGNSHGAIEASSTTFGYGVYATANSNSAGYFKGGSAFAPSVKIEQNANATAALMVCGNADVDGNIRASGTILASQGITCTSDGRFKKNIAPIADAMELVSKLRGVTYSWKKEEYPGKGFTDQSQIGVIAQEVEKILPELVFTDREGYKSVDYSRFTPVLIEAIKHLHQEVNELKSGMASLVQQLNSVYSQANAKP